MAKEFKVEVPNCDSWRIFRPKEELEKFLEGHGNPPTVYDSEWNLHRVPAFAAGRKEYSDKKQLWCNQYGCE